MADLHKKPFDGSTKLKLEIFGECFKAWFPVFLYDKSKEVYIFDFFAGNGKDSEGVLGSPLILLHEAKGKDRAYCSKSRKPVKFIFNDLDSEAFLNLNTNVSDHIHNCEQENNCGKCVYDRKVNQLGFKSAFESNSVQSILNNEQIGKFVLLDQFGFKQIDEDIFKQLIQYPKTDFIFFISSIYVRRFKDKPATKLYFPTDQLKIDASHANECHRIIANHFRSLIPLNMEYYLHHFTIQKETKKGNYYGLIFGSNHTYGMEKFLKVCWQKDKIAGESNCNIDNDLPGLPLFPNEGTTHKKDNFKVELKKRILSGDIIDNISGMKYTMKKGCMPGLFVEVVKELEKEGAIARHGNNLNYSATTIHKAKKYSIRVMSNANHKD
jgi:three-Cys-motif partner protein